MMYPSKKTFSQFIVEAEAASNIRSLSPYKVMPPLKTKEGNYNPAPQRYLIDPVTGFGPGQFKQAKNTKNNENNVKIG